MIRPRMMRIEADGSQSFRRGKLSDDRGIRRIEELLQNARGSDREREEHDFPCQAAVDHIDLISGGSFVLGNCFGIR